MLTALLATSILLQFLAAIAALRLIPVTKRHTAWFALATAVLLMGIRRSITLCRYLFVQPSTPPGLAAELVALLISALMLAGIVMIKPLLATIEKSNRSLHKANRMLRTLSGCNQAILRVPEEAGLMQEICRAIVETGGYRLAWVGFAQQDGEKSVRPVAQHGFEQGYLENAKITWSEGERGRGPTGTAIRTGKPSIARNILTDPHFSPWREQALQRGYASSIALPLIINGDPLGALNIYAKEPDAFDEEEISFLEELAGDLSYGIEALRMRAAKQRAEEEKRSSEEQYRTLFETMYEGFALHELICDEDGNPQDYRFLSVNPAFEELTGLNADHIIGRTVREVIPGIEQEWIDIYGEVALRGERTQFERESGPLGRHYAVSAFSPEPGRFATLFMDMTERERAQQALRESEERFRAVTEGSLTGIYLIQDGNFQYANPAMAEIFGYAPQDIIGKLSVQDLVHPEDWQLVEENLRRRLEGEVDSIRYELRGVRKDGSMIYCEVLGRRRQYQGKPAVLGTIVDVTDRKRAEQELENYQQHLEELVRERTEAFEAANERLRAEIDERERAQRKERYQAELVRNVSEAIISTDPDFRIVGWNPGAESIYGWKAAEVTGRPLSSVLTESVRGKDLGEIQEGLLDTGHWYFEERERRKDGADVEVGSSVSLLRDQEGSPSGVVVVSQDIGERRRTEREVNRIYDLSIDMVGMADFDGNFTRLNPAWERTLGYSSQELMSRPYIDFVHPEDREATLAEASKLTQGQVTIAFENRYRAKDGSYRWLSWNTTPDASSGSLYFVARDITREKETVEQLRRLSRVYQDAMDAIVLLDPGGRIIEMNPEAERIFGWQKAELIGKPFKTLVPPERHERADELLRRCSQGEDFRALEGQRQIKAGKVIPVLLTLSRLTDEKGDPIGTVMISKDITELKQAEAELEAFVYSVSHDLRAPLRAIDGFSNILMEEHAAELSGDARHYLDLVRGNAQQMGALINDLLTFSRLGRAQMEKQTVEPREIVRQVLQELSAARDGRKVKIDIGDLPSCRADPKLLKLVFANLLDNALKYTRPREVARIEVGCQTEGPDPGKCAYFVQDNGVGFDMQYADKLFGVFQRLHRAEEFEGTGVGLASVQRIIHRHGGEVWAEAEVDKGATFYFTLS
jgi:PAS domain S-box-containing protein